MEGRTYFVLAFALIMIISGTASSAVITVDDSGGKDFSTIQAAINAANESDTILVYPGTYTENVDVNRSVTLLSESGDPGDTTIIAFSTGDHTLEVTSDNVTIKGFNITGAGGIGSSGILMDGVQNNIIEDNILWRNDYGIHLTTFCSSTANSSSDNLLENNSASFNFYGIYLDSSCSNNTLKDNDLIMNTDGIIFSRSCDNNHIINNNASYNHANGIYLFNCSDNTLMDNKVSENYNGIRFVNCSSNALFENMVTKNNDSGIYLDESDKNELANNTAYDNSVGLHLAFSSNSNSLIDNDCYENDYGLFLEGFSDDNILINNFLHMNNYGLVLLVSNNNSIKGNNVHNNNVYGIALRDVTGNIIYNNIFNNDNNTWFMDTNTGNLWNISRTTGPNIVEGPQKGGNYWARPAGNGFSQTCTDSNNDGFCDMANVLNKNNTDLLPLNINASIDVEKFTNGYDSGNTITPGIHIGDDVEWKCVITNNGNVILNNITLSDNIEGNIKCPDDQLIPGTSMECAYEGTAEFGHYINIAYVTGQYKSLTVNDSDTGGYYGFEQEDDGSFEPPAVPTASPFITAGVLGILVTLLLIRQRK